MINLIKILQLTVYFNHCSDHLTNYNTNRLFSTINNMASYMFIILGFGLFLFHVTYAAPYSKILKI